MKRWYSSRGTRRGLVLALLAAAAWSGWAIGYLQGTGPSAAPSQPATSTTASPVCCTRGATV